MTASSDSGEKLGGTRGQLLHLDKAQKFSVKVVISWLGSRLRQEIESEKEVTLYFEGEQKCSHFYLFHIYFHISYWNLSRRTALRQEPFIKEPSVKNLLTKYS